MESLVLCPEELCLGPVRLSGENSSSDGQPGGGLANPGLSPADLTIWTTDHVEKGTRFLPWKGTVRSDKLRVYDKLPEFDVSFSIP
jgi:hypothetical protein